MARNLSSRLSFLVDVSRSNLVLPFSLPEPATTRLLSSSTRPQPDKDQLRGSKSKSGGEETEGKREAEERQGEDQSEEDEVGFVNKETGEVGGPRGPEPTRYGDWEKRGRCSDF